jgi:hypothetical protein
VDENGEDSFFESTVVHSPSCFSPSQNSQNGPSTYIVSMHGRFVYVDDPTWPVIANLQARGRVWKQQSCQMTKSGYSIDHKNSAEASDLLVIRIAVHIRVPEDYCPVEWKEANAMHHAWKVLQEIHEQLQSFGKHESNQISLAIDLYTEKSLTFGHFKEFRKAVEGLPSALPTTLKLHRQTPLLEAIRGMATADVFIPASSYLSALVAFCAAPSTLVIVPNESTRRTQYLAPHLAHASEHPEEFRAIRAEDRDQVRAQLEKVLYRVQGEQGQGGAWHES